jgi:hypothetical protein
MIILQDPSLLFLVFPDVFPTVTGIFLYRDHIADVLRPSSAPNPPLFGSTSMPGLSVYLPRGRIVLLHRFASLSRTRARLYILVSVQASSFASSTRGSCFAALKRGAHPSVQDLQTISAGPFLVHILPNMSSNPVEGKSIPFFII